LAHGRATRYPARLAAQARRRGRGQLYFPDTLTDKVYARSPYNSRPGRSTRDPDDSIYRNGGSRSTLKLKKVEGAYTGSITMGLQR
jgi:hypothetical protein